MQVSLCIRRCFGRIPEMECFREMSTYNSSVVGIFYFLLGDNGGIVVPRLLTNSQPYEALMKVLEGEGVPEFDKAGGVGEDEDALGAPFAGVCEVG